MSELIDLTGKKFGKLTVIERSFNGNFNQTRWLCKCDCGNEVIVQSENLRNGVTKSCNCLRGEFNKLNPGLSSMRMAMMNYKNGAKTRRLKYNLTEEQFKEITQQDCYYCGAEPNNKSEHKGHNGIYIYNGLDRIDNKKGYTIDNVVPCCWICNIAKHNLTLQEFKDWIRKVYKRLD